MALNKQNVDEFSGDKGRVLLLGQSGTGKTTLAGSVAEMGKTLYAYTIGEEGISSLKGEKWSKNVDVVRLTDPTQVRDVYHELLTPGHGYKGLVIDSVSALDRMWRKHLLGLPQEDIRQVDEMDAFMDIQTWGRLADITMDVMTSLFGLASHAHEEPVHVVMTSQVQEFDDETSGETLVGAAVSKGCRVPVHACPDYTLHLQILEDEDSNELEAPAIHRVRLLPDERLITKLHTTRERKSKTPAMVGNASQILTMKKFFKMMGVPE